MEIIRNRDAKHWPWKRIRLFAESGSEAFVPAPFMLETKDPSSNLLPMIDRCFTRILSLKAGIDGMAVGYAHHSVYRYRSEYDFCV